MNATDVIPHTYGNPLLQTTLQLAVPLRIHELEARGGPSNADWKRATAFGPVLAERGDVLQFGGKKGEAAQLFNELAYCMAVIAFCPGGLKFCGKRYEGKKPRRAPPPAPGKRKQPKGPPPPPPKRTQ